MGGCGSKPKDEPSFFGDSHVTIVPYFTVPDGKMDEFKAGFPDFYEGTKKGTKDCLYYGFCISGNEVHCREGYKNAEAVLAHLGDVKAPLDKAVAMVGEGGLKLAVMGPAAELEKLKEPMGALGTVFWEMDEGSMWFSKDEASSPDTHVSIVPYFSVPDGKIEEFKNGFPNFYKGTMTGTKDCLYYGFCVSGNQVFCREGYKNAEAVLAHLGDVKAPLDKAVAMVGEGGLKLAVMGPKTELEKLKEPMGALGTVFWELDSGAGWNPATLVAELPAPDAPGAEKSAAGNVSSAPADSHVTIVPYFTVPDGKMDEFKAGFPDFYNGTRKGTKDCLYYGFCISGNEVHCREGYKNAEAVLAHLGDVKAPLDKAVAMVGEGGLKLAVMGPKAELEKLKEPMGALGTVFWETDQGAMWFSQDDKASPDTHVTIVPYFAVPDGKLDEFKAGFPDFYKGTQAGTKDCLYYGFCVSGSQVFCREGYKNAEAVLAHLGDVKAPLDKAVAMVGEGGLKLAVMGPASELEKLKEPMGALGTVFWELDSGAGWNPSGFTTDSHVTIVPYFTVPDGKMDEFKAGFPDFYEGTKKGTKDCLYYGFCISGNEVHCREGYKNAEAVLAHLGDVKAPLDKAVAMVGEGGLKLAVMGPKAELEKLKEPMGALGTVFWETDEGAMWFSQDDDASPDTHVTIVPYFTVPDGKLDEFKAGFPDFYKGTKTGTKDCLYYGFCVSGNQVFCREGYKNAEAVLAHLGDVKAPLDKAVAMAGDGGLKLAVMGPKAELEKLKEPMGALGTVFWELDSGAGWNPGGQATPAMEIVPSTPSEENPATADSHVTIVPYFTVPDGKMDEFKAGFPDFYEGTKQGTKDCLYYGFCISGNEVHCREGYKNAEAVLAHLGDVKAPLDKAVAMVGEGGLKLAVMGPASELEKLKEPMGALGTVFWETDEGAMWFSQDEDASPDTHVTIVPYFTVPDGKMDEFKAGFPDFYKGTKTGTKDCLYYGFCVSGNQVFCREGYKNAEAVLAHLGDVKAPLDKAVAMAGDGGLKLAVMGPKAELEKLKEPMGALGTVFWELDSGAGWNPGGQATVAEQPVPDAPACNILGNCK